MALRSPSGLGGGAPVSGTTVTATTQFLSAFSTSAAPGYSFTGGNGTGMFSANGTDLRFAIANNNTYIMSATQFQPATVALADLGLANVGWKRLYIDFTNSGTVGNVVINKAAGRVNLGAGGSTLTLTNSLITANSHIFLNADNAPGNVVAVQLFAVAAAGSCTINAVPVVTNQTAIDFFVVNAD